MKPCKIFICDCDHKNVAEEEAVFAAAGLDFRWLHCTTEKEVIRECQGASVLLNQYVRMNETVFSALPALKCVVRYGVGVDNIDLDAAARYGVQICNVPDYGVEEVADQALALMMALKRKVCQTNAEIHRGIWNYQHSIPIRRSREQTAGIIGVGRIGTALANRLRPLGCKILGTDPAYGSPQRNFPDFVEFVELGELLRRSDIVSVHCPLNAGTRHLIGKDALQQMKSNAILINTARGGILDENALEQALREGRLAGVGLDVAEQEPLAPSHPLLAHENVIFSPHIAWYSEESARELKRKCAEEAVRFLKGEPPRYPINLIRKEETV